MVPCIMIDKVSIILSISVLSSPEETNCVLEVRALDICIVALVKEKNSCHILTLIIVSL